MRFSAICYVYIFHGVSGSDTDGEFEWKTRKQRIDARLKGLFQPWKIMRYREGMDTARLHAVVLEEYPTASGPADYALFVHGKLLGFLEAKKVSVGALNVLEQAKRYSRTVAAGVGSWRGYRVPFLFSSSGECVFFLDVRQEHNLSRPISGFHTADALAEMFGREGDGAWFDTHPIATPRLHPYQTQAIVATEQALRHGERALLLAMATGTGKTFTTVTQVYRLLESKQFQRILFLVDRRALAVQAVREFAAFATPQGNKFTQEYDVFHQQFRREDYDDDRPFDPKILPEKYLTRPDASHTFVYVATIQRMTINLFGRSAVEAGDDRGDYDEDAERLDIPIHAFDLIIADECHRGYTGRETGLWRDTINHFDAIKLGLTATPAAHTMALFERVVFRYTTEEAIQAGYLVDYEPVKIKSNVRLNGAFLKAGEQVGIVDTATGKEVLDQLEDERAFATTEIERKITAPECNRKIIEEIAKYALAHEREYDRFPKILIFADNDLQHTSHADQLVKLCKQVFGRGDDFVQKITGNPNVDRPLQKIREFRNRPQPKIVVSVDMLTTGVDIPALEFIVFLRPVQSRILWTQMLGRGTRLCPEINKGHFVVFDCFNGTLFEYFKGVADFSELAPQRDPVPLAQVIENIYQNTNRDYYLKVLRRRLLRVDREMGGQAREQFAAFVPDGDLKRLAEELPARIKKDFTATMKLLRNADFQKLLEDYPRAKRGFMVGYDVQDEVSSEVMIRAGAAYQKPEDYLVAFSRFVQENPEHIEAIRILLERPKEWRTEVLGDLRQKLALHRFAEPELQKAVALVHHKALADIISIIKHAARATEPILSADERARQALAKVTAGQRFAPEQEKWLDYIRQHLAQNLTLDVADFDAAPIFEQRGGLRQARKIFAAQLEPLIRDINAAIAA